MLAGIGQNAGVVDLGDGWAATFKIESHNHPSYLDPRQGAATGIGGVVRDILAMGARPVGAISRLFLGPADAADTARVLTGAADGMVNYANTLGLGALAAGISFDHSYTGNPLVNAGCVGVLRANDLVTAQAT